ncbi:MAG: thioredoxin family protein [Actinobacteria bacterium]|nr:MAG: thioredoxin family protein [Actinomycetota bacterium]
MLIKILGSGCANCRKLEELARKAVGELGIDATVEKVTGYPEIMAFGIISTPGLVIDDVVKLSGRVPAYDQVKRLIAEAR